MFVSWVNVYIERVHFLHLSLSLDGPLPRTGYSDITISSETIPFLLGWRFSHCWIVFWLASCEKKKMAIEVVILWIHNSQRHQRARLKRGKFSHLHKMYMYSRHRSISHCIYHMFPLRYVQHFADIMAVNFDLLYKHHHRKRFYFKFVKSVHYYVIKQKPK